MVAKGHFRNIYNSVLISVRGFKRYLIRVRNVGFSKLKKTVRINYAIFFGQFFFSLVINKRDIDWYEQKNINLVISNEKKIRKHCVDIFAPSSAIYLRNSET